MAWGAQGQCSTAHWWVSRHAGFQRLVSKTNNLTVLFLLLKREKVAFYTLFILSFLLFKKSWRNT